MLSTWSIRNRYSTSLLDLISDDASPAPERLHGMASLNWSNVDVIRAYQAKKAQDQWGMTPLPIAKNDMTDFEDQVFGTKDFYDKQTLVLFVHDAPDVVVSENAMRSSKMDLSEAFLVKLFPLMFLTITARFF